MNSQIIEIRTKDGVTPCHFFSSEDGQKRPAAIIYMDAFGIREALRDMAGRLASSGYRVLLPDLYYRWGPTQSFDPKTAFTDGPDRDRLRAMFTSLTNKLVMEDTGSFLEFLRGSSLAENTEVVCVESRRIVKRRHHRARRRAFFSRPRYSQHFAFIR